MKRALFALTCLALPATAQTPAATPELTRAANALAAIWRPVTGAITAQSIQNACAGAAQEIAELDAAMPSELTAETGARVRAPRALHVIPITETPGAAYFFPPSGMTWFTSGLGGFSVLDEAQGFVGVRDAAGQDLAFQLGHAGNHVMLRVRSPQGDIVTLAACEPIAPLSSEGSGPG